MSELVLTAEHARVITGSNGPVRVVDEEGRTLGCVTPSNGRTDVRITLTDEELAEIKRRMQTPGPGRTTEEILEFIDSLETR